MKVLPSEGRADRVPYALQASTQYEWFSSIPSHWTLAPLYARYSMSLGKMLDAKQITGSHLVSYLRNVDVQWDNINTDDLPEMDIADDEYARYTLQEGDLLVCEGGEVGRAAIWTGALTRCGFQKALHRLRPRSKGNDCTRFLYYVLRYLADCGVFVALGNPNTIPHLTGERLRVYRLPFPPLTEQEAIARFLDRETAHIDALLTAKDQLLSLLRAKREAFISQSVTQGLSHDVPLKPTRYSWLPEIPHHWIIRPFRYAARIVTGQVDPEANEYSDLPLIAPNHIISRTGQLLPLETAADQAAESGKYYFRAGVVLYSKIRPELVKVCIAPCDGLCSADMYPITPRSDLLPEYLMYFMLTSEFTSNVVLSSIRIAMPKVNRQELGAFPVLVPPLQEQEIIVNMIRDETTKIDQLSDTLKVQKAKLVDYRASLITAAVTGQIDVRGEVTNDTTLEAVG